MYRISLDILYDMQIVCIIPDSETIEHVFEEVRFRDVSGGNRALLDSAHANQ